MIRQTLFMARNGAVKVVMRKVSRGPPEGLPAATGWPGAAIKNHSLVKLQFLVQQILPDACHPCLHRIVSAELQTAATDTPNTCSQKSCGALATSQKS